jgi:hypothetical protein
VPFAKTYACLIFSSHHRRLLQCVSHESSSLCKPMKASYAPPPAAALFTCAFPTRAWVKYMRQEHQAPMCQESHALLGLTSASSSPSSSLTAAILSKHCAAQACANPWMPATSLCYLPWLRVSHPSSSVKKRNPGTPDPAEIFC